MKYPCEGCLVDPICRNGCELLLSYLKSIDRNPEGEISQQVVLTRNRSERAIECASYGTISSDLYCSIVLAISSLMLSLQPVPKDRKISVII